MKRILFERPYQPFLFLSLVTVTIAIFFKGAHPESDFDICFYNLDFSLATSRIWFIFSAYLFILTSLYFLLSRTKLKMKRWLITLHYTFIVLFLILFALFSSFSNRDVERLMSGIPFSALISIYGTIFLADAFFFILGLLFLLINIFTLKNEK